MMRISSLLCAAIGAVIVVQPLKAAEILKVSSFSTVLTEIAQKVGGERIAVTGHISAGTDPHDFQPKAADLKVVANADIVLLSAKHLEGYTKKLKDVAKEVGRVVEVGNEIPSLSMPEPPPQGKKKEGEKKGDGKKAEPKAAAETHHDEHDHGDEDPHWWHSVKRTKQAVRVVRDHLTRISPTDKALFAKNAAAYEQELTALHNWVEAKVAELPKARRKLVTTHDAFGYLAADYGFTVYAVSGISTGTQPSSKAVSEMIGMIKKEGVKAVFCEDIVSPKIMARVAGESGARFGGLLLSDGLGTGAASTYVGMVKQNITTIVDALQ